MRRRGSASQPLRSIPPSSLGWLRTTARNVRELENALERWLVDGECRCVPPREAERIARTLDATGGNVARAARRLGLARSTLRDRIERHALGAQIPRD